MRSKFIILFLFMTSLFFKNAMAASYKTYIVFQSGFSSCSKDLNLDPRGSNVYKPMNHLLHRLKLKGIDFEHSTSCFPFDLDPKVVRYYLKDKKSELQSDHVEIYNDKLKDSIKASGAKNLVIISHSHGAWLAMKQIINDKFKDLNILFISLDAISMKNCSPPVFVRNMFLNTTPFGPIVKECREFPRDFNLSDLKEIKEETSKWVNIYQDDYYYIQSSRSIFADRNYNFDIELNVLSNQHADQPNNILIQRLVYKSILDLYKTKELR